jgi:hypothetical protein
MHLKNFVDETIPYNTIIEEDFDEPALLVNIKFPWWSWKIPGLARENKAIIARTKKKINKYKVAYVELRLDYNMPS